MSRQKKLMLLGGIVAMPEGFEAVSAEVALAAEGGEATLVEGKIGLTVPAYGYVIVNK